jgi:N-acetylmuramoyl-L-alanine amidase
MSNQLSTLNAKLLANSKATSYSIDINDKVNKISDALVVNKTTVLGQDVGQTVNGIKSLDNLAGTVSGAVSTADNMVQCLPSNTSYPSTNASSFSIGISAGVATVVQTIDSGFDLVFDSANDLLGHDSANGVNTISATISMTGTDVAQGLDTLTASLTGIVPPIEPITIISLGGGALDEIAGAIEVASERKSSLLSEISAVASASTKQDQGGGSTGLGSELTSSMSDVTSKMDEVKSKANSGALLDEVAGAVSAVEGIGDKVAQASATATDSLAGAIGSTLGQVTDAIGDGLTSVVAGLGDAVGDMLDHVASGISSELGNAANLFEDLTGSIGNQLQGLFGNLVALDNNLISDIMSDVMNGGDINLTSATKKLINADRNTSDALKKIVNESTATDPQSLQNEVISKAKAQKIPNSEIDSFSGKMQNIESALDNIDATISGSVVSEAGEFYTEDLDLKELAKRYDRYIREFPYVDSKEELELEMHQSTREFSELIVHASETYTNANIGAEEIQLRQNDAGHLGIQYHYIIRRDGTVQRGLPLNNIADASDINRHKFNCIDVCLIGGVNVPSESDNPLLNLSSTSFTQTQYASLETIIASFYKKCSGGQVLGHNAIDANSQDPYFDVLSYVENKFGKKSVYKDPLTETSKTRKELVSARPV